MSYTSSTSTATLTLSGVQSARDAAQLYVDWLVNNPEEILDCFEADATAEEVLDEVLAYISFEDGDVVVRVDSESDEGNYSSEYFNSITSHLRSIMSSELMTVNWSCFDSRDGVSSGTYHYDANGKYVDNKDLSRDKRAMDQIAALMSGVSWSPDTLDLIAEIVRGTGRPVGDV